MTDYMPSESEMREAWVSTYARDGWLTNEAILRGQREFRAWLTQHDAEVAAKAWDEGFDAGFGFGDGHQAVRRSNQCRTQQEGTE